MQQRTPAHFAPLFLITMGALLVACSLLSEPTPAATPTPVDTPTPTPEPTATPAFVFGPDAFSQGLIARRNGDYARALAAFQVVLNGKPTPDLAQEAQFRLGEAYWLYGDDDHAVNALNAYLQGNPTGPHALETHYFLADAYRTLKDYGSSLAQYRIYRDQTSTLQGDIDGMIADVLVVAGDSEGGIAQYDRALQDTTLSASTKISILMRAAEVHAGRNEQALAGARYDAALALTTDARTRADLDLRAGEAYAAAGKTEQALARWGDAVGKYPEQPGAFKALVNLVDRNVPVDDFQRGLVDYNAASYDAAITAFKNHLKSNSPRAGDTHYYLGSAYARKGAYTQAIAEYDTIIKTLPKDKRVADAYFGKASAYGTIGKIDDAVAVYKKFAATFPDNSMADDALWRAAQLLDRSKRYDEAATQYEAVQSKFPARERAAEALFWAGMNYYREKDFKTASARWQSISKDYTKSSFYTRALFWLGKAAQARGQTDAAKTYWTQAAGLPKDYYAWRAADKLNPPKATVSYDLAAYAMGADADRVGLEKWLAGWANNGTITAALDAATQGDLRFRRGAELLRLDRTLDARREFLALIVTKQEDPRALYALALYLRDNNLFSLSMDCAERINKLAAAAGAPAAPRLLGMLRYPTYYSDLVVAESKANQVDPLLYFGLIRQESAFNPWATSSSDARGLGQVVPATGREIAQRLGVKNFSLDQLYLPYVSVRFGVWYLAQDLKLFNEPAYALMAYNAGAGRAKQWQDPDLDFAIEKIDLTEPNTYVRIVYSNWRNYQTLYRTNTN